MAGGGIGTGLAARSRQAVAPCGQPGRAERQVRGGKL
jgi:hypothetical protein